MEVEEFAFVFEAVSSFVVDNPEDGQDNSGEEENR